MPITPETWALIRHDYEHTDMPVTDICATYGTTPNTLRDRVRRWKWTPRHVPIPAEGPPPLAPRFDNNVRRLPAPQVLIDAPSLAGDPPPGSADPNVAPLASEASAPVDPATIGPRLKAAVARVLPAIEAIVARLAAGPMNPRDMERAGRALGTLTRTLRELNALLGQYPEPVDRGPDDEDEFILELARKMDHFAAAHANRAAQPE